MATKTESRRAELLVKLEQAGFFTHECEDGNESIFTDEGIVGSMSDSDIRAFIENDDGFSGMIINRLCKHEQSF